MEEEGNKRRYMGQLQDPFYGSIQITKAHTHNGSSRASQVGKNTNIIKDTLLFNDAITMLYTIRSSLGNISAATAEYHTYLVSIAVSQKHLHVVSGHLHWVVYNVYQPHDYGHLETLT